MGIPGAGSPMASTEAVMGFPSVTRTPASKGGLTPSLAQNLNSVLPGGSATQGNGPTDIPEVPLTDNRYIANLIQSLTNYRPSTASQQKEVY